MRKLTAKQKKLLTAEWYRLRASGIDYPCAHHIPDKTYLDIDNINPCEMYYYNARYLFDNLNDTVKLDKSHIL